MLKKRVAGWILLWCLLAVCCAYAQETAEQVMDFGTDVPAHIRRMLDENGYADAQVVCGASIEREAYDERGMSREVSTALLITEEAGQRAITGLQWVIGPNGPGSAMAESFGSCGLELNSAVCVNAVVDGSSPINRRFALHMADGSSWELLTTYKSSWRVYRYTGPDGFVSTLNSGRLRADNHYFYLPHSGWLGNWPDLSAFPQNAEEASNFMGRCWEGVNDRSLVWGANLRGKPTSSSRSQGEYHVALAEVLEEKPGKQLPWYRVRIGNAEGWMSGPYVVAPNDQEGFAFNGSLGIPWAEAAGECSLYDAMNPDSSLLTLPAHTFMQVLAQTEDGWAHVLVTDCPQDFSLSAPGTYGYVRLDDVVLYSPWSASD